MSYGMDSDVIGFADSVNKFVAHTVSKKYTEGKTSDSKGDVVEHVNRDTISEHTFEYNHVADAAIKLYDTATSVDFRIGKVIAGLVVSGVEVPTANNERPKIKFTAETCAMADSAVAKYDVTLLELAGNRKATKLGATVGAGSKLISMTAKASANVVRAPDSEANTAALQLNECVIEATSNYVGVTAAASATVDTGWKASDGPGTDAKNTDYASGSLTVKRYLVQM